MKIGTRTLTLCLLLLLNAAPAAAHNPSLHAGKAVEGRAVAIDGDLLTVQTAQGPVEVRLGHTTKFERGDERLADRDDLKVGDHVAVFGSKLPGGRVGASAVHIHGRPGTGKSAPHEHGDSHAASGALGPSQP